MDSSCKTASFYFILLICITGVDALSDSNKTVLFIVLGIMGGLIFTVAILLMFCCYMQANSMKEIAFKEEAPKCHKKTKVQTIKGIGGIDNTRFDLQAAAAAQYYNRPMQYPASSFFLQPYDVMDTMVLPGSEGPPRKPRSKKSRPKPSNKVRELVDTKDQPDSSGPERTLERPPLPALPAPSSKVPEIAPPKQSNEKLSSPKLEKAAMKTQSEFSPSFNASPAILSSKLKSEKVFGLDQSLGRGGRSRVEEEEEEIQPNVVEFGSVEKAEDDNHYDDDINFFLKP